MTLVQLVNPVRQSVGANRANIPTAVSKHLTPLERELEAVEGISLHQFNQPVAEVVGRVSVVTPTTASRARFHPQLWQCFVDQSWPDKELVVVETYDDKPSAFFQHIARVDSRLKYTAIKRPVGEDLTVGAKRNLTILLASGQYCVNFDDDDLYANRYVESMVTQMQQRNLVAWRCQVGTISSRLEALQDIRGPNHGIQKMKMKWMRSCMAMVLAMCTFEWWPCFIRIPIWPLRRTLLSCWNCGRRWERVVLDSWKILMAFACTSSTRAAAHLTLRSPTAWLKRSWTAWSYPSAGHMIALWTIIPRVSRGSLVSLPVYCFNFGLAEATCEHAGRTNWFDLISPMSDFTIVFASISPSSQNVLGKWAKKPLHSSLKRKIALQVASHCSIE